jgi:5-methylcytosine-specific restriction endonuclease McrA
VENRRTREFAAEGRFTAIEWVELVHFYSGRCAYCGSSGALQPDHATPLSRGGDGYIENIRPACGPCNRGKHTMTEDDYRERRAKDGLYVRPRLRRVPTFEEASGSFSASLMSLDG